jgi:hypothetical protein
MINYSLNEIQSLIERFENQKLPKSEWTHEAHLVVAIWYCFHNEFDQTLAIVRNYITQHNTSVGTPNTDTEGYHETITKFWILIASAFLKKHSTITINVACNNFINSNYSTSYYPLNYYSKKQLFSTQARHHWIEPDLSPLEIGDDLSKSL